MGVIKMSISECKKSANKKIYLRNSKTIQGICDTTLRARWTTQQVQNSLYQQPSSMYLHGNYRLVEVSETEIKHVCRVINHS